MKYIKKFEDVYYGQGLQGCTMNYKERKDFHCGVETGEIVKLDKDYIKNLDEINWGITTNGYFKHDSFTDEQLNKEYVLVNFDSNYGYVLRNIGTNKRDFLGWVPPEYIRHLTEEELELRNNIIKYNI